MWAEFREDVDSPGRMRTKSSGEVGRTQGGCGPSLEGMWSESREDVERVEGRCGPSLGRLPSTKLERQGLRPI